MARSAAAGSNRRRNATPRKGATTRSKKPASSAPSRGLRVPGWLCGLIGLVAGFALAQYFQQSAPPVAALMPKPATQQASGTAAAPAGSKAADKSAAEAGSNEPAMPTFEFYTLLPESEVVAPKVEAYQSTPRPGTSTTTKKGDKAAKAASYMLQAASFRDMPDAKRLAGRLSDLGLKAKISDVKANGNQTWHRVQVGPYDDTRELSRAKDLMVTQGIEPLMIRLQQ
ncbi:MAG: sporulation related protein [Halomonadaceae bacterium T82-2]|nr:MAG: sporulation related protein [Halomonadaceae bacterium T82-2]